MEILKRNLNKRKTRIISIILVVLFFGLAVWASSYITGSEAAQEIVRDFGYIGIVIIAFFGGLNIVIPVPAVTFVPVFLSAGLSIYWVILSLVIGTTLADLIAYTIGNFGREKLNPSQYKVFKKLESLTKRNYFIPIVVLFIWAAVVPLPNEILLIPLGLLGFQLRSLVIPFIAGNIVHHTLISFGISNIIPFI